MENEKKEEYNNEPVYYCMKCLSLNIRHIQHMTESEYCDNCGSADIGQTNINTWEELYKTKYGHYFLEKEKY